MSLWMELPDSNETTCSSSNCESLSSFRFEAGDVGSYYCTSCKRKVEAVLIGHGWTPPVDAHELSDAVNTARKHRGAWCFRDGEWTQGSTIPETLADEVMRLRVLFRVNMLHHVPSASHASIDALLYPELPDDPC